MIIIVVGAQYGSEAKGAVAGYICQSRNIRYAVRTGATNAGHTVYYQGHPFKMQQLPVGWVNPRTQLVIGAGALIDPVILEREVLMVEAATGEPLHGRLTIDPRAGVHAPEHRDRSSVSGRHYAIGATGKGCSEATIDRIRGRGAEYKTFGQSEWAGLYRLADTARMLNVAYDDGLPILLEGTQGHELDLFLGPYPYTTHKQTQPATWLAEVGLSPALDIEICAVVRTYPIRVAGNSGPLPGEISWPELARTINERLTMNDRPLLVDPRAIRMFEELLCEVAWDLLVPSHLSALTQHLWSAEDRIAHSRAISELNASALKRMAVEHPRLHAELMKLFEMTTVTQKLRRIGTLNFNQLRDAAQLIRPTWVALTFMNYVYPELWGINPWEYGGGKGLHQCSNLMAEVEEAMGAPVLMTTFGPQDQHIWSLP